jgi:LacI family transcriptional regulator
VTTGKAAKLEQAAEEPGPAARPGGRKATINDIARLANVSKKTVSRVINNSPFVKGETRDQIKAIIDEVGFAPDPQARGLAFRRSFLIGFIYDNPNPQYIVHAQQGILDGLGGSPFELVIRPVDRRSPGFLQDMRTFVERQKLGGMVLFPSVSEDERLASLLNELECPYVRIGSVALDQPGSRLVTHDSHGGGEAARHIAEFGHQRIAHIHGPLSFRSAHERRRGFREALEAAGLSLGVELVIEAGYTFETGRAAAEHLLALDHPPTAIFAGNDEMAFGVYAAAREAGLRIPEDLSVVGFDDSPIASRVWPGLTTVRLPIRDMGRIAAEILVARRRGEEPPPEPDVTPALVVRRSCAAPAKR